MFLNFVVCVSECNYLRLERLCSFYCFRTRPEGCWYGGLGHFFGPGTVDQFGADIQEGAALRADFASEASMAGAYAVSALAKDTDTSDPMVTRFVIAVKQPSKLVSATESAALGVGHRVSCAWPLPSQFPPRGSRLLLAQESLLSC